MMLCNIKCFKFDYTKISPQLFVFNLNIKIQNTEKTDNTNNEWINWIEEAVDKEFFKFYEYDQFSNLQQIGTGGFEKVFCANWKNLENILC